MIARVSLRKGGLWGWELIGIPGVFKRSSYPVRLIDLHLQRSSGPTHRTLMTVKRNPTTRTFWSPSILSPQSAFLSRLSFAPVCVCTWCCSAVAVLLSPSFLHVYCIPFDLIPYPTNSPYHHRFTSHISASRSYPKICCLPPWPTRPLIHNNSATDFLLASSKQWP
jgi:hypothetical protein